jgi:glutamate---methylamine ligase
LRALSVSSALREGLGPHAVAAYLKLKHEDWNAYTQHLTE